MGSEFGVFKSTDNGNTWISLNTGLIANCATSFCKTTSGIYAGASNGISFTNDYGENWKQITNGLEFGASVFGISTCDDNVYVGVEPALYSLSPDKASWNKINDFCWVNTIVKKSSTFYLSSICGGIAVSSDNGGTWTIRNNGFKDPTVYSMILDGTTFYTATIDGMYKSTDDCQNWQSINQGLGDFKIDRIKKAGSKLYASTYSYGVFCSVNNGDSWQSIGLTYKKIEDIATYDTVVFAATSGNGAYMYSGKDSTWIQINEGLNDSVLYSIFADNKNIYLGTSNNGVWKRPLKDLLNINDFAPTDRLTIYPNPVIDKMRIIDNINFTTESTILIYNSQGQLVLEKQINPTNNELDLSFLKRGLYIAKLSNGTKIESTQFMKE